MDEKYAVLFEPMVIRGKVFKNRILGGPLGNNISNPGAEMLRENIDYYGKLASGGAARIVGGGDAVVNKDAGYMGGMGRVKFFMDPPSMEFMNSMKNYAKTVQRYNCLAFVQFFHGGAQGERSMFRGTKMLGPSAMKFENNGNEIIEMTPDDINRIIGDFAKCAGMAKAFGLDGCIVHAGHGNLLDQFRARDFNQRTDEFGGSVENRCRFPIMVMKAIRQAVGDDFILEYRTSVDEFTEGGITIDESIEFFKLLEAEGVVDLFHITAGRHIDALSNSRCIAPCTFPEAPNREFCRQIKTAGIKTPLVIVNSCADPEVAADIIRSGDADFINLSRQINLADPFYPRKLREGKEIQIDNCIRCHGCYDVTGPCSVNPRASEKIVLTEYNPKKVDNPKKVCVIGGGIAGMTAANEAANRGHQVILFEKNDKLGGQLEFTDYDTMKKDLRRYKNNMVARTLANANIDVRLNTEATPEMIEKESPEAVIATVGAVVKRPNIKGADLPQVFGIVDAFKREAELGHRVTVVGNGLSACESALHFQELGHEVTIIGRRERICFHENFDRMPTALYDPSPTFMQWFEERDIRLFNNMECVEITEDGVKMKDMTSNEEALLLADSVILASGMTSCRDEALAFANTAGFFAMAGDCVKPGKVKDAVYTAYWNAIEI